MEKILGLIIFVIIFMILIDNRKAFIYIYEWIENRLIIIRALFAILFFEVIKQIIFMITDFYFIKNGVNGGENFASLMLKGSWVIEAILIFVIIMAIFNYVINKFNNPKLTQHQVGD